MPIKHAFTNPKSDGGDATVTRPSDWNADHIVTGMSPAFIGCKVYRATSETITDTFLSFDNEEFDTDGFHDNATNNTRLTVPAGMGGVYLLVAHTNSSARARLEPFVNGVLARGISFYHAVGTSGWCHVTAVLQLNAGDYVQVKGNVGGSSTYGGTSLGDQNTASLIKLDSGKVGAGIGAKVYKSTQTLTDAMLAFDNEVFDTDGFHDNTTNNTRLTIPAGLAGKYLVQASTWVGDIHARLEVWVNGSIARGRGSIPGYDNYVSTMAVLDLAAGDYVEIKGVSGGSDTYGDAGSIGDHAVFSIMRLDSGSVGPTRRLLDYTLSSDISGTSMSASTWTDVITNQSFTKWADASIIEIAVRGFAFTNTNSAKEQGSRVVVDSGGTPINEMLGGHYNVFGYDANIFAGSGSIFLTGLTAGVHTVKVQAFSSVGDAFYCRPTSSSPEFLRIQVVEHPA